MTQPVHRERQAFSIGSTSWVSPKARCYQFPSSFIASSPNTLTCSKLVIATSDVDGLDRTRHTLTPVQSSAMSPFRRGPAGGSRRNPRIFFVQTRPPYFTPPLSTRAFRTSGSYPPNDHRAQSCRPTNGCITNPKIAIPHPSTKPLTKGFTPARSVLAPATADLLSCAIDSSHQWLSVSEPPTNRVYSHDLPPIFFRLTRPDTAWVP